MGAAGALGIATLVFLFAFLHDLPSPTKLRSAEDLAVSSQIFDRNGNLLYEIFSEENRTPIDIDDLPPYVAQATIAIEDQRFYRHFGLDIAGIMRALISNATGKSSLQGASTLTQQLVKVSLLTSERTWERKAKEAVLTIATEVLYTKKQILEMYLNHVPYGGTAWGIEAASQTFFDKPAKDLTLAEAAYLTGLPQSPSRYSPFGNTPELGIQRQKEVLRRMVEDKYITQEQADQAASETLIFSTSKFDIEAPHFVFYVRDQLIEQYGQAMVERGGLRVTTTLDLDLQKAAQASLSAEIDRLARYRVGNGASVITRPNTGEILAMVGSRDYFNATAEGQINMVVRERQPGSSIKPLTLATGMQMRRITPATALLDIPTCFENPGQAPYCPRNYDNTFHGPTLPRQALANSYNIPAIKNLGLVSLDNFMATASAMGISTFKESKDYGLSLALGAGETTMLDMAKAFGTMANQGVTVPTVAVLKVEDFRGETLYEFDLDRRQQEVRELQESSPKTDAKNRPLPTVGQPNQQSRVHRTLDPEVTYLVSEYLSDNQARSAAFGTNSQLFIRGRKVAVKTGTTNDLRDNWTIGYTPDYLVAVWVGNNNNRPMNQSLVSGVTGAAPIWNDIMTHVLRDNPPKWPDRPETIIEKSFCRRSGLLPSSSTPADRGCEMATELFWKGTEPTETEAVWKGTWIMKQTGLPPREGDPTDQLELQEHILLTDPFTQNYCLTCTRVTTEVTNEKGEKEMKPVEESYFVTIERLFELANGILRWTYESQALQAPSTPPPAQ